MMAQVSGILLVDKKPGITSFAALDDVKRALGTKKIGHTGTLDSFASGLLVVLAGNLTRLAPHITALKKTYRARVQFGSETDTLDPLGEVIKTAPLPRQNDFLAALGSWTGNIMQEPPQYSAIKIAGKRASDMARNGKTVRMERRPVTVYSLDVESMETENSALLNADILVSCSAGTYIRSLARDIARECNSAGHLTALRRLSVGNFSVDNAAQEILPAHLLAMTPALAELCGLTPLCLSPAREKEFFNGVQIHGEWFADPPSAAHRDGIPEAKNQFAVFDPAGAFLGVIAGDFLLDRFSYGFTERAYA